MTRRASRVVFVALLQTLLAVVCQGDDVIEYGRIDELRGVKAFFIDSGTDLDVRDLIKERVEKLPGVEVLNSPDHVEHALLFRWSGSGNKLVCDALVVKRVGTGRMRVLANYRASEMELNDLATEFGDWFVKQYRRINNLK